MEYFSSIVWNGGEEWIVSLLAEKMEKLSYMLIEGTIKRSEPLTVLPRPPAFDLFNFKA